MADWVRSIVTFSGDKEELKNLKTLLKGNHTAFDFEKIIPTPSELMVPSDGAQGTAKVCARARRYGYSTCKEYEESMWSKGISFNELANLGDKYQKNLEKFGCETWYEWRMKNWGTRWNTQCAKWFDDYNVEFDTATSMPDPIFKRITLLFPNVEIYVAFADEILTGSCGYAYYNDSKEPNQLVFVNDFEFACNVWGVDPKDVIEKEEAYAED